MHCETLTTREEVLGCKARWDDLCASLSCTVPYMTHEWYANALASIDSDKEPLLIFFRQDGRDVGMAPFVSQGKKMAGMTVHRVSFVDNPYTPNQQILGDFETGALYGSLLGHIGRKLGPLFYLDLDEMRLTEGQRFALASLEERGKAFVTCEEKSPSRYLILKESFEATLQTLDKHTQREFKRKMNRMGRLGAMGLEIIEGPERIKDHLGRFFRMYARTWKGAEPHPEFYHRMCSDFEARGELFFTGLTIGGRPVAYLISILSGDTMYGIKTTYDPSYYAYSPGIILFYKSIEQMFRFPNLKEFDIGRGEEQFKREWTELTHSQWRTTVYPGSLAWKAVNRLKKDVMPVIRENERLMSVYTKLRRLVLHQDATPEEAGTPIQKLMRFSCTGCLPEREGFTARYAAEEDLDLLTVAMASPNFAEVKRRLETSRCALVFEGGGLAGYFWLPAELGQAACGRGACTIDEWGMREDVSLDGRDNPCIGQLVSLVGQERFPGECVLAYENMETHQFEI